MTAGSGSIQLQIADFRLQNSHLDLAIHIMQEAMARRVRLSEAPRS
jgi:hypothetical protein